MREIEVKILEIDKKAVEQKLRAFGARKVFDGPVDVLMYDTAGRTLKKKGTILRLRKKGVEGELTVKTNFKRTDHAKTSSEYESAVDFSATKKILQILGYTETFRLKKWRTEYVLGNVHFEIDKLPGIPWFLEIEAPSEQKLSEWVKKLGFKQSDVKNWWWHEVLSYYKKKGGRRV